MDLVVMAAGMGSRYGGLKQLDPVGPSGETVMDYAIYDAVQAGTERIVFVIRRDIADVFAEQIGSKYADSVEVRYAFQELDMLPPGYVLPAGRTKPWGTGHATLVAAEQVSGPFVVTNADDFYGRAAYTKEAAFFADPATNQPGAYSMVAFRMDQTLSEHGTVSRGVCEVSDGKLTSVVEHVGLAADGTGGVIDVSGRHFNGDEPVSLNFWGLRPDVFDHLERLFATFLDEHGDEEKSEFYLPAAIDDLIANDQATVTVLRSPEPWFGVTYREDRERVAARLAALVADGVYPKSLRGAR